MSGGIVVDGTEILVDGDAAWAAVAPWESAVRMDKDPDPEDEPLDDKPEFDDEFGEEDLEGQDGDFEDEDDENDTDDQLRVDAEGSPDGSVAEADEEDRGRAFHAQKRKRSRRDARKPRGRRTGGGASVMAAVIMAAGVPCHSKLLGGVTERVAEIWTPSTSRRVMATTAEARSLLVNSARMDQLPEGTAGNSNVPSSRGPTFAGPLVGHALSKSL